MQQLKLLPCYRRRKGKMPNNKRNTGIKLLGNRPQVMMGAKIVRIEPIMQSDPLPKLMAFTYWNENEPKNIEVTPQPEICFCTQTTLNRLEVLIWENRDFEAKENIT